MDREEIRQQIEILKAGETTYQNCAKLADLFSVLDHLPEDKPKQSFSGSAQSSDFLFAARYAPESKLLSVMNDHMEAVRVLYPKEYQKIIRKLKES